MALIRNIEVDWAAKGSMQPTQVDAKIKIIESAGQTALVQIDTFGSQNRKIDGKLSQTIQFDRKSAVELVDILKRAFRF